jgi:hypothetical protein
MAAIRIQERIYGATGRNLADRAPSGMQWM